MGSETENQFLVKLGELISEQKATAELCRKIDLTIHGTDEQPGMVQLVKKHEAVLVWGKKICMFVLAPIGTAVSGYLAAHLFHH